MTRSSGSFSDRTFAAISASVDEPSTNRYAVRHRMLLDRITVVRTDIDIDTDDSSAPEQLEQGCHENERSPAGDPRS